MQVIMVVRLHAMYQQSRKVLIPLVVFFVAATIVVGVSNVITTTEVLAGMFNCGSKSSVHQAHEQIPEEVIISCTYQCIDDYEGNFLLLDFITWLLGTVWEVLALFLAVRITVKHFRELRQHSAGGIIGDCFTVLMKTHVVYFAR
jgi:phosphotransferase system  glucose/maltose/N-acetylglucosamine-specific IIC component